MGQGQIDGAEVVGDLCGRPDHGRVHVCNGDEFGRSVDRLDPAGSHPFGP
jgi:hypothetical protein